MQRRPFDRLSAALRRAAAAAFVCAVVPAHVFAQCPAEDWIEYKGTRLKHLPGSTAYFYLATHMAVDADGAPNAYHPDNTGLDFLANAGFPNGGWKGVLVVDPVDSNRPFIQTSGPFAGFFLAKTTLEDPGRATTDPARYVDATTFPYLVFPSSFHRLTGTGTLGDLGIAFNVASGEGVPFLVADIGPADARLGEVSIRMAESLGGQNVSPRTGAGVPRGTFMYVIFPRSRRRPAWPVSMESMTAALAELVQSVGGESVLRRCMAS
jgi:hypothetical protein